VTNPSPVSIDSITRLPASGDNVAIATRRIEVGTNGYLYGTKCVIAHTVLEGHRLATRPISKGQPLLSWGFPFGVALTDIKPGDYVCNQSMLDALSVRHLDGAILPSKPNFSDLLAPFAFDEQSFQPGRPVERAFSGGSFHGFRRAGRRGVGTRNFVVILGTTSRTASFARQLAERLQPLARVHPTLDGIVAVAHTEGGGASEPHNASEVLRALAGFMVHSNVGAVLAVDYGVEPITNARLRSFMEQHQYPLGDVPHQFLTLRDGSASSFAEGERIVRDWLPLVCAQQRSKEPISGLRVALQCGGSDAFSGVSGNPLAGAIARKVIAHGGSAVLTETDEAVGAEAYILRNVRDLATARAFLGAIDRFKTYLSWHGVTPETNPSGGNKLRGLYNIALKSLGAVQKKAPRTRLDTVINYAEPLRDIAEPNFTFMNGPGNDLEGIAGQVGSGCNLILFVTGNGSVTNFPFVPTLKITTTTGRHQLLINEMDINAGRYLDGEQMEGLADECFELTLEVASGRKTKGEHAGHSQVSLWRNWPQNDGSRLAQLRQTAAPDGAPLACGGSARAEPQNRQLRVFRTEHGFATERVGLVLPTSLCSAQIARLAAERLTHKQLGRAQGISRFVALTHTEGCGSSGDSLFRLLGRSYRGYLLHPNVAAAMLLEHGCEKITNDVMRGELGRAGVVSERFGWASVQLDGGIAKVLDKIEAWFAATLATFPPPAAALADLGALTLGLMTSAAIADPTASTLASVTRTIVGLGGSVLIPESDSLLANPIFNTQVMGSTVPHPTLSYGEPLAQRGLHIVASETDHWVENLTGLGGCGTHLVLSVVDGHARQGHPLFPVIQIAEVTRSPGLKVEELDLLLTGNSSQDVAAIEELLVAVAELKQVPVATSQGLVDFQFTRGSLGVTS
jgi:altronate dehydratase